MIVDCKQCQWRRTLVNKVPHFLPSKQTKKRCVSLSMYKINTSNSLCAQTMYQPMVLYCDNCEAAFERFGMCSHAMCYNCKYEFCYMCGGEYDGWLIINKSLDANSIPFCESARPGDLTKCGNQKRFGKCLCRQRTLLEQTSSQDLKDRCLSDPTLGHIEGFGFEKLSHPFEQPENV